MYFDTHPLKQVLGAGLTPLVYGDVAVDAGQDFTIISTEQIFDNVAELEALTPPPVLERLHDDHVRLWRDFADVLAPLEAALLEGTELTDRQLLASVQVSNAGPTLNVDRSLAVAAAFRGELG